MYTLETLDEKRTRLENELFTAARNLINEMGASAFSGTVPDTGLTVLITEGFAPVIVEDGMFIKSDDIVLLAEAIGYTGPCETGAAEYPNLGVALTEFVHDAVKKMRNGHYNLPDLVKKHVDIWRAALIFQKNNYQKGTDTDFVHELTVLDGVKRFVETRMLTSFDDLRITANPKTEYDFVKPDKFFDQPGNPGIPDIEEDLGRLLVKVSTALDFVLNGPASGINLPQHIIDEKFNDLVIKLIPEIRAVIENRIMVKYTFSQLVNMSLVSKDALMNFSYSTDSIESANDQMARVREDERLGTDEGAFEIMACLAAMITSMQVIMNMYGWTWDVVKLKARQQLAESEGGTDVQI